MGNVEASVVEVAVNIEAVGEDVAAIAEVDVQYVSMLVPPPESVAEPVPHA